MVVLYRAHYPQAVKVVEWCKKNGIRIVFDTDDALDLVPPENLNYKAVQSRLPLYEFLLRSADVVTTTTDTLASHLRKWNPNVTVIPNSVDPDEWIGEPQKRGSTRRLDRKPHSLSRSGRGPGCGSRGAEEESVHVRAAGNLPGSRLSKN